MALSLTSLAAELRLGDGITAPDEPVRSILNRLQGAAEVLIDTAAPNAPTAIRDEAIVRIVAYLYDQPTSASGGGYAAAWRNSGAASLTSRFVERRAVQASGEGDPAPEESGGALTVARVREIVQEELRGALVWR